MFVQMKERNYTTITKKRENQNKTFAPKTETQTQRKQSQAYPYIYISRYKYEYKQKHSQCVETVWLWFIQNDEWLMTAYRKPLHSTAWIYIYAWKTIANNSPISVHLISKREISVNSCLSLAIIQRRALNLFRPKNGLNLHRNNHKQKLNFNGVANQHEWKYDAYFPIIFSIFISYRLISIYMYYICVSVCLCINV